MISQLLEEYSCGKLDVILQNCGLKSNILKNARELKLGTHHHFSGDHANDPKEFEHL